MSTAKKYIITRKGGMEDKSDLFAPPANGLTKFEVVLLIARRARIINQLRIDLQKKYRVHLIEKSKPTMVALEEYMRGEFGPDTTPKKK